MRRARAKSSVTRTPFDVFRGKILRFGNEIFPFPEQNDDGGGGGEGACFDTQNMRVGCMKNAVFLAADFAVTTGRNIAFNSHSTVG